MRFNLRQLLVAIAFVAIATAYVAQSVRYRDLAARHEALELRFARAKDVVKAVTHVTVVDEAPDKVTLQWPAGWPSDLKDEWKDLPPNNFPAVMASRLSEIR